MLTDEQWARLKPLLPPQKPRTGRPSKDHRTVLNAILWIDRTGAPWRDLPEEYGPWRSVATRFYRWVKAGVWDRVLGEIQRQADAEGELDWKLHHVDGSVVRAHQHAAGAKKGEAKQQGGASTTTTTTTRRRGREKIRRLSDGAGAGSLPRSTFVSKEAEESPWPS
jgi:transposase